MKFCPNCQGVFEDRDVACPKDGTRLLAELTELPSDPRSMIGHVLEKKYRIDSILGSGGMAFIMKAIHLFLERAVAIKILKPELLTVPELRKWFLREAKSASETKHPGIVEILDFGITGDGIYYLVMEILKGENLFQYIQRKGILTEKEAAGIAVGILDALGAVHNRGIVHRDVKPDNFVLQPINREGAQVKLVDFGLAKVFDPDSGEKSTERITRGSVVLGSPHHMSPEQARGMGLDARSDLYAVGCILYEMCTGKVPFEGANSVEVMSKQLVEEVTSPREHRADLTEEFEDVILGCLAKDPESRFRSARELSDAILAQYPDARSQRPTPVVAAQALPERDTDESIFYDSEEEGEPTPRFGLQTAVMHRRSRWPAALVGTGILLSALLLMGLYLQGTDVPDTDPLLGVEEAVIEPDPVSAREASTAAKPLLSPGKDNPFLMNAGSDTVKRTVAVLLRSIPDRATVLDKDGTVIGQTPMQVVGEPGSPDRRYTLALEDYLHAAVKVAFEDEGVRTVMLEPITKKTVRRTLVPKKKRSKAPRKKRIPKGFIDPFGGSGGK